MNIVEEGDIRYMLPLTITEDWTGMKVESNDRDKKEEGEFEGGHA